uniref:C-type lectin domain family 12 member B n=1 Tax=Sus scrofa TaxID=9823 RepID=A0A8D0UXB3_PIG
SQKYFFVKRIAYGCHENGKIRVCHLLCLGVLQTSNEINSDSEKLSQLQKIIHQQQDNLSQQLSYYRNFPTEEELKSQISNLLKRQRQMAVKLCQELIIHTSDHKCKPCPKTWHWHRNSCYYFATNEEKTWPNSRKSCMDKNSTLVKIDSLEEKVS